MDGSGPEVDVAIAGDGPAGSALAAACAAEALSVVVVGDDRPWRATYGTWRDDLADLPSDVFAAVVESITVWAGRRHELDRAYGVLDNDALRDRLRAGIDHRARGSPGCSTSRGAAGW